MFFEQSYYVLRTFHWIYLPTVEFTMFFERFSEFISLRSKVSVLTRATLYRSCICLWHLRQNTASGREWARDCSKNDHSVRITLYFCRAQSPYFCIKHHPLLRTRFLIDLWDDVPAEGDVLLLCFEFCLVGGALLWIGEDGCRLRLGCF